MESALLEGVINGPRTRALCTDENCTGDCNVCNLLFCSVCGLCEGCLTTECPGVESFREHQEAVYAGQKDFVDGAWQLGRVSPHSPAYCANR